jgi:hypothetical protein
MLNSHHTSILFLRQGFNLGRLYSRQRRFVSNFESNKAVSESLIRYLGGGGEIGRNELLASKQISKEAHYYPADINHQVAEELALRKCLPIQAEFCGAVDAAFGSLL